jgi:hypothetical protein
MMNKGGAKKAAYDKAYNAKPEQVKNRMERNQARAQMMREGKVAKGDNKDVNHKRMLDAGGSNSRANLEVTTKTANRGWRKGKHGYSTS